MAGYVASQALLQDLGQDINILNNNGSVHEVTYASNNGDDGDEVNNMNNRDDGEENYALTRNMHPSCFQIKEPKANDKFTGEQEAYITAILERYMQSMHERTKHHLGYPINMDFDYSALGQLLQFSINNVGDPFIEANYGVHSREYEIGVLDWFARLWEIGKDEYWGYITSGGTEGNLHGILVGREAFPDGILYASKDSHYSIFKAAHMYRMDIKIIETLVSGEINYRILKDSLLQHKDKPAIVNINIGTTYKGAVDDLDLVIQTLEKCGFPRNRFYIHCDGAFSGVMVQKLNAVPLITFKKSIDSVSVSGHKFVGCPMPCGVQIVRRMHIDALSKPVEYLATRDATISGGRNGHTPIFMWCTLHYKGHHGLQKEVQQCVRNAKYLKYRLQEAGVSSMLNELSSIVVFERPQDEEFIRHWQLSCQGNLAHICVVPNVTIEKLEIFIIELVQKRSSWFNDGGNQPPCVASDIGMENCACTMHK